MKILKTLTITLFMVLPSLFAVGCRNNSGDEAPIDKSKLPQAAQSFIKTYFSNLEIAYILKERDGLGYDYEVRFTNGTQIDFDNSGEWTDVDCIREEVPAGIVPQQIVSYAAQNFPNQFIVKIERDRRGYEIKLSAGLEINFDKNFRVTEFDD